MCIFLIVSSLAIFAGCRGTDGLDGSDNPEGENKGTYSISGTIKIGVGSELQGVTVELTGAKSVMTSTDANGKYTFYGLENGTYTITPTMTGYTFSPSSLSVTVSGANATGNNLTATQYLPARSLPNQFVGYHWRDMAQFKYTLDRGNMPVDEYYTRIQAMVDSRVNYNMNTFVGGPTSISPVDTVVLVVSWADLEPERYSEKGFETLHRIIYDIKKYYPYVILYIWSNAAQNWKAWPDWLTTSAQNQTYNSGNSISNWFPWAPDYQNTYRSFLNSLAQYLQNRHGAVPDAVVINAGGEYGEQVLGTYQYMTSMSPGERDILYSAEKTFVQMHVEAFQKLDCDLIMLVNSLAPEDPAKDVSVPMYASNLGVTWIQVNAGIWRLVSANANDVALNKNDVVLLKNIKANIPSVKLILEDESSATLGGLTLAERVSRMNRLLSSDGIQFKGVTLNKQDFLYPITTDNRRALDELWDYLLNP